MIIALAFVEICRVNFRIIAEYLLKEHFSHVEALDNFYHGFSNPDSRCSSIDLYG